MLYAISIVIVLGFLFYEWVIRNPETCMEPLSNHLGIFCDVEFYLEELHDWLAFE